MKLLRRIWSQIWWLRYIFLYRADKVAYLRSLGTKIGNNCYLYNRVTDFGTEPWLIEIGENVTIAGGVTLITHDGSSRLFRNSLPGMNKFGNRFGTIQIFDNCFIGQNALILPDITIGPNSIVGASSVVTKPVPPETIVVGNPAREYCTLQEYIEKYRRKMIKIDANNREELRNELTTKLWGKKR